jgi:HEAT repeat protein
MTYAQHPENRTATTIIADVLAQTPAQNQEQYKQQQKDLLSTGENGISQLAKSLETSKGNDAKIKYALSGLASYVSDTKQDADRLTVVNAYLKALNEIKDADAKAFIISQLEIAGKEEIVAKLTPYLNDASKVVSDAAVKALASINGPAPQQAPLSEKEAKELLKKAEKSGQIQDREAALQLLMAANPANVVKLVRTALKDESRDYRNAALNYAQDYESSALYVELSNSMKKASPELKTDILNWFTIVYDKKGLTIEPFYSNLALPQLSDKDLEVRKAAIALLVKTDNDESMQALAKLLDSADEQNIQLAKEALIVKKGNIASVIVPYLATAPDKGKIAILQLLAGRKADEQGKAVFEQLNVTSPEVRSAAYTALKEVVTVKDLSNLYQLLEKSGSETLAPVQQAVIAALKPLPKENQFETVSAQINKTEKSKQQLYYSVLAASENANALAYLIDRFKKGNESDRNAAFQALLNWQGLEVADELLAIAKQARTSSDSFYASKFDKALARYVQLVSTPELNGENRRIFLENALEIALTDAQKNDILKQIKQTNSYLGLLLAGEYLDKPAVQQAAANAVRDIALNNKSFTGKNVRQLLEKAAKVLNNPDADYQREAIRKHLNELPEEEGFISLFNGKDLTGWKGLVKDPIARAKMKPAELAKEQIKADEQMRKDWKVENGLLVFDGTGYDNICTGKQYGDFEMYVDWQLAPSPEADAGIYLRGTPQVQMWNIARTNVGAQVGSGGLYNNQENPSKPLKVADNKLGEWNNLYIKMIGDRVTVLLNGELVVDNIILENYWNRSQPIFPIEQIELQAHGSKVYYRNIYVKELERPKPFELSAQEKKEGFQMLFDGTNMHEWTGNLPDYRLEEGTISVHPGQSHGGNLYTKKEYANFAFRFEFQLTEAANNGVGIRAPMEGDNAYNAMEIQILDCEHPVYANLMPYQHHGSVYGVIAAGHGSMKPVGEWNEEEIYADGDHIRVTLNGKVILDGNIREAAKNGTIDHKEHPGLFNKSGHIGFLGHGNELKFKNIRIKELK